MLCNIMDVAALAIVALSPSKTCRVRVSSTRYRNDPYRARVLVAPTVVAPMLSAITEYARAAPVAPKVAAIHVAVPAPVVVAAAQPAAPQVRYALVGFKHETSMYQAPFRVSVGDVVVVEADRGEHVGVVQEVTTVVPKYNVPSRILRHAGPREFEAIDALTVKERATTASIQKLAESLGLGIRVVDTEFQMDTNKLTVFFSSKVFVDFRKLQRGLFREFRCRIWLVNWAEVRPYTPVAVNPIHA